MPHSPGVPLKSILPDKGSSAPWQGTSWLHEEICEFLKRQENVVKITHPVDPEFKERMLSEIRRCLDQLTDFACDLNEICVPAYCRWEDVEEQLSKPEVLRECLREYNRSGAGIDPKNLEAQLVAAMLLAVRQESPLVAQWLWHRLTTRGTGKAMWIWIDYVAGTGALRSHSKENFTQLFNADIECRARPVNPASAPRSPWADRWYAVAVVAIVAIVSLTAFAIVRQSRGPDSELRSQARSAEEQRVPFVPRPTPQGQGGNGVASDTPEKKEATAAPSTANARKQGSPGPAPGQFPSPQTSQVAQISLAPVKEAPLQAEPSAESVRAPTSDGVAETLSGTDAYVVGPAPQATNGDDGPAADPPFNPPQGPEILVFAMHGKVDERARLLEVSTESADGGCAQEGFICEVKVVWGEFTALVRIPRGGGLSISIDNGEFAEVPLVEGGPWRWPLGALSSFDVTLQPRDGDGRPQRHVNLTLHSRPSRQ